MEKDIKKALCNHDLKDRKHEPFWGKYIEVCDKCGKEFQVIKNEEDISKRQIEIFEGIIKEEKAKLKEK